MIISVDRVLANVDIYYRKVHLCKVVCGIRPLCQTNILYVRPCSVFLSVLSKITKSKLQLNILREFYQVKHFPRTLLVCLFDRTLTCAQCSWLLIGWSIDEPHEGIVLIGSIKNQTSSADWTQTAQKARVRFWCRNQTEFISDQVSAAVMHLFMFSLLVIIGLQVESAGGRSVGSIERSFTSLLTVHNGMKFGSWGQREMCPSETYAAGFSLKVSWALTHET